MLAITVLLVAFLATQGTCQSTDNPNLAKKYSTFIDEAIAKCRTKAGFLDSKSQNIRRQAFIACLKGTYMKANKEDLVSYLITIDAAPSRNRVQYHLNKRFYQAFRPRELHVFLEAGQMLNRSN